MTTVLMVESRFFGAVNKSKDNKLATTPEVSESQSQQDNSMIVAVEKEIMEKLEKDIGAKVIYLPINNEPRSTRAFFDGKTDCLFVNESISAHHFTDNQGKITRRVVILYPMGKGRRGELPKAQLVNKLTKTVQQSEDAGLELLDLRDLEAKGKVLEGLGALNFSYNGKFVYMALSGRSNEEVLDIICSKENLNIPEENRFVFTAVLPRLPNADGVVTGEDVITHTSLVGWCGKGICAWGFEFLRFPSEEKQEAFYHHLEVTYQKMLNLNAEEIRAFVGNAYELAYRVGDEERHVLCISDSAMKALQRRNLKALEEWYGRENIIIFYADVVQRRAGKSVRALISAPVTHGEVLPAPGQKSALEVAHVDVMDVSAATFRR
ncbi:uncharacterized protein TM35_000016280 [Trypanosoma theileri]|uniref:Amidinotransferase n=1 Tax=Trypanosoma theileri TaxID=67003 RepID=A0A1X0PAA5_9TRYP|nr:uncharacterized protein TM35_000016280 [Trypanosoma theileri]ORC93751.1 hypothetical protein TM35_000016280 [Trypanosoma theileri]